MRDLHRITLQGIRYLANVRTGIVRTAEGALCGEQETRDVLRIVQARQRANASRRDRESILRDSGLRKVRGALGGTYWE